MANSTLSSGSVTLTKTTSGVQTLLPAVNHARMIVSFVAEVTEDYNYDTGTMPAVSLGDSDNPTRWDNGIPAQLANNATSGANMTDLPNFDDSTMRGLRDGGCILAANKAIIVTCTPAVGDGTGGCKIVVVAVDAP